MKTHRTIVLGIALTQDQDGLYVGTLVCGRIIRLASKPISTFRRRWGYEIDDPVSNLRITMDAFKTRRKAVEHALEYAGAVKAGCLPDCISGRYPSGLIPLDDPNKFVITY